MATLKSKEISKMNKTERERKLKELKLEIIKSHSKTNKQSGSRKKEMRRIIARINTFNTSENKNVLKKT